MEACRYHASRALFNAVDLVNNCHAAPAQHVQNARRYNSSKSKEAARVVRRVSSVAVINQSFGLTVLFSFFLALPLPLGIRRLSSGCLATVPHVDEYCSFELEDADGMCRTAFTAPAVHWESGPVWVVNVRAMVEVVNAVCGEGCDDTRTV